MRASPSSSNGTSTTRTTRAAHPSIIDVPRSASTGSSSAETRIDSTHGWDGMSFHFVTSKARLGRVGWRSASRTTRPSSSADGCRTDGNFETFARHNGHADLIHERFDGRPANSPSCPVPSGDVASIAMPGVISGRLLEPSGAPPSGERVEKIASIGNVRIEQILSGHVEPTEYLQGHDEWVVVLVGAATLDVNGVIRELGAGDWVLLPAGTPHRLLRTQPGTSWLAVHLHADEPGDDVR